MLVGDHVIVPQYLDCRVCHVVASEESYAKRGCERRLVGHRGMLVSDTRLRAVHGYVFKKLVDQTASSARGESRDDALHQGWDRQGMKLPLEMGVLSFVQNVDKELRNGGKASTCGIHAGI